MHAHQKVVRPPNISKGVQSGSPDNFFATGDPFGATNAVRQLTNTRHKGGRKRVALPGSKLQPLFKNHTAPPRLEHNLLKANVLPSIGGGLSEQESLLKNVMCGNLGNLPSFTPSTVRVYICSNYEDMRLERDMLMTRALPQLQEYCSQWGLVFQLVDLHWGVDKALIDSDFNVRNIHQREIADCQRLSLGPNFVALLGDKYGTQQLISEIPETEFEVLYDISVQNNMEGSELLTHYYLKDTNAVPISYRLQIIEDPSDVSRLIRVINECAVLACEGDKLSPARKRQFLMSSLEEDIIQGIIETKDPRKHCLCYRREFQNIRQYLKTTGVQDFFDMVKTDSGLTLDESKYQNSLRMGDSVAQHLGVGNYKPYYLPWSEEGVRSSDPDFQNYLGRMCSDFIQDMKDLIQQHMEMKLKGGKRQEKMLLQEVLHHMEVCRQKSTHFQGQKQLLFSIEKFLRNPRESNKPFVIYGEMGSGKSAAMAQLSSELKNWFSSDCVVVFRALGTSSESTGIYNTVISMTQQICIAYGLPLPDLNSGYDTLYKTLVTFRDTLTIVSKDHAFIRPLFILLDGIHVLQPHEQSLQALWAIRDLPPNVHIVISTVPQIGNINLLAALAQLVTDTDSTMEVEKLTVAEAKEVISAMCKESKRQLTGHQEKSILSGFGDSGLPLHLKVMAEQGQDWTSYSKPSEFLVKNNVGDYLKAVLDRLEEQYGSMLVMALCGYLTTCPVGIQERELIDLILCDQDAEEDLERYPDSVAGGLHLMPPYIMAQLKFKLRSFLTEHSVCGKRVLAWSHKLFYAAVAEKYHVIYPGIDEHHITEDSTSYTLMLHENMANMYLKEHRLETISAGKVKGNMKGVPVTNPQPVNENNLLKLQRVPTHLRVMAPVEGLSRAKEAILFNFNWLQTKMRAKPLFMVIQDLLGLYNIHKHLNQQHEGLSMDDTEDIEILLEFLQLSQESLAKNPQHLAAEILGRLGKYTDFEFLDLLLKGTRSHVESSADSLILPMYQCFTPPEEFLRHRMEGPTHFVGFLQDGLLAVMFSQRHGTDIWHTHTGSLVHRFKVNPEQKLQNVIPGTKNEFVIIGHYSHLNHQTELRVISSQTGVKIVDAQFQQNFEALTLNKEDNMLVVATSMELETGTKKCLIGVDVRTKDVLYTLPQEEVHEEGVTHIEIITGVNEGECLLTIGSKRSRDMAFWDLDSEEMLFKLELGCFVDQVKVIGIIAMCASSREGVLLFIDLREGKVTKRVEDTELIGLTDMIVSENGGYVLIATRHNGVNVYDAKSYLLLKTIADETKDISNQHMTPSKICLDPYEQFLFVGYDMGQIVVYLMLTGQEVLRLDKHTSRINSLHVTSNMSLFSAGQDHVAHVWHLFNHLGKLLQKLLESQKSQMDNMQQFQKEVDKVKVETMSEESLYPGTGDKVTCVAMTTAGDQVFTSQRDGPVKVWDPHTGQLLRTLKDGCSQGASHVYLACKDSLLIGHCHDRNTPTAYALQAWRVKDGERLKFPDPVYVFTTALFPSGDRLFAVSPGNNQAGMVFSIYDLFEMKCVNTLHCNMFGDMNASNLQFIGLSRHFPKKTKKKDPSVSREGTADPSNKSETGVEGEMSKSSTEIMDTNLYAVLDYFPEAGVSFFFTIVIGGEKLQEISMEATDPIELDSFSPGCCILLKDGHCITGTMSGELVVWNVATQKTVTSFCDREMVGPTPRDGASDNRGGRGSVRAAHSSSVTAVVVSEDMTLVLSGGADGLVKVWNMTRRLLHTLEGHSATIRSVWLGADGDVILSASDDKELCAHRVHTGQLLTTFYAHEPVTKVLMTKDKLRIAAVVGQASPRLLMLQTHNF